MNAFWYHVEKSFRKKIGENVSIGKISGIVKSAGDGTIIVFEQVNNVTNKVSLFTIPPEEGFRMAGLDPPGKAYLAQGLLYWIQENHAAAKRSFTQAEIFGDDVRWELALLGPLEGIEP